MPKPQPLSVVIVNWNTGDLLCSCLESIQREWADVLRLQLIVVDNHSTDDSLTFARRRYGDKVEFLSLEDNIGFGPANNLALGRVQHPYTLFLNPDTVVVDEGIGEVISFAESHPEAGFVGCRLLNPDGTVQHSQNELPSLGQLVRATFPLDKILPGRMRHSLGLAPSYERVRRVGWLRGAFLLARTDLIRRLGGFDPSFFMYGEDLDICYRARLLGYSNYFVPYASVVHYGNVSGSKKYGEDRLRMTFAALRSFLVKHRGERYAQRYLRFLSASYRLKRAVCRLVGRGRLKLQEYEGYIKALNEVMEVN